MSSSGGGQAEGTLGEEIDKALGSFDSFREQFAKAAVARFGSGWAWLCVDSGGGLVVTSTANQDNPVFTTGQVPILGLDVWEHAYYLNYQNRRPEYIAAWWNIVDWDQVATNLVLVRTLEGAAELTAWAQAKWARLGKILGRLTE